MKPVIVFILFTVFLYVFQQVAYKKADTVYLNRDSHFLIHIKEIEHGPY